MAIFYLLSLFREREDEKCSGQEKDLESLLSHDRALSYRAKPGKFPADIIRLSFQISKFEREIQPSLRASHCLAFRQGF